MCTAFPHWTCQGPKKSTPQYVTGGAGTMGDFGRSAISCSPWFPRRWRHVTHLEINCLTIAFPLAIHYPLERSSFKVIPLPLWCVLSWTLLIISEVMWLDFGRITGLFRLHGRLVLRILPPTIMTPSLSRTGSNVRRELVFLNRAFFSLSDSRLPYMAFPWMSWRLFISDVNSFLWHALWSPLLFLVSRLHWLLYLQKYY